MKETENKFKTKLCKEIRERFPGSMVFHLDPTECQGIPDLLILYKDKWATLEGKRDEATYRKESGKRPHQEHYVKVMNEMSFSAFIYPENKEEVLNEMEQSFKSNR